MNFTKTVVEGKVWLESVITLYTVTHFKEPRDFSVFDCEAYIEINS